MYHAVGERGEPGTRFVLPVDRFEKQMAMLARLRFRVLGLEAAVGSLLAGESLPRRAVALTFDDGTRDTHALVISVLRAREFPATAFVVTGAMGASVTWTNHADLAQRPLMTWDEALQLQPLVALAPHTRTHPSLRSLDDQDLADEVRGSREDLEQRTGRPSSVFAYPYGHYDARVAAAVAEAGYAAACTVHRGVNDATTPSYELRRFEIRGDEPFRNFVSVLALGR
jgi:peptidoglycan/xylan/chitin deacetylase (PgdA/CDA1 family)